MHVVNACTRSFRYLNRLRWYAAFISHVHTINDFLFYSFVKKGEEEEEVDEWVD